MFERYVNFEFYKTLTSDPWPQNQFERYVNFEFYKTEETIRSWICKFERYVNLEFYKKWKINNKPITENIIPIF